MKLRYVDWKRELNYTNRYKVETVRNKRWYFDWRADGVCDVTNVEAIEKMLRLGKYKIVWEDLGVRFDESGDEIKAATATVAKTEEPEKKKIGRPKKVKVNG